VGKARELLEDYLTDPESYDDGFGFHDIALFLLKFTDSAQQAGTVEGKLKRQLDSERLKRQNLARQIESLELELATIRTERKMLQEQVEALKNIEETLRTRELSGDEQLKK
jgi:predicted ribosome quality control (RQC) complex YloA/Tae2 family protein